MAADTAGENVVRVRIAEAAAGVGKMAFRTNLRLMFSCLKSAGRKKLRLMISYLTIEYSAKKVNRTNTELCDSQSRTWKS